MESEIRELECPLCGGLAALRSVALQGYKVDLLYDIYSCSYCLASFAQPLESNSSLYELIYRNIGKIPGYNRYLKYYHTVKAKEKPLDYLASEEEAFWAVAKYVRNLRNTMGNPGKILEIGSGLGYLTYALNYEGFLTKGIDISQHAVDMANNAFGQLFECIDLGSLAKRAPASFDIIIMNELLEHVPDIISFLGLAAELLSPSGVILISTPNKSIYDRDSIWDTELPPVHLWWLSEESLNYIGKRMDFSISFFNFREYYEEYYRRPFQKGSISNRKSTLGYKGDLIIDVPSHWEKDRIRTFAGKVGFLSIYRQIRDNLTQNKRWRGSRGPTCSAILSKNANKYIIPAACRRDSLLIIK